MNQIIRDGDAALLIFVADTTAGAAVTSGNAKASVYCESGANAAKYWTGSAWSTAGSFVGVPYTRQNLFSTASAMGTPGAGFYSVYVCGSSGDATTGFPYGYLLTVNAHDARDVILGSGQTIGASVGTVVLTGGQTIGASVGNPVTLASGQTIGASIGTVTLSGGQTIGASVGNPVTLATGQTIGASIGAVILSGGQTIGASVGNAVTAGTFSGTASTTINAIMDGIDALGGNAGIYGCTATCQEAGGTRIPNAVVQLRGTTGNAVGGATSNQNGVVVVHFTSTGSHLIYAAGASHTFGSSGQGITLTGNTAFTLVGTPASAGSYKTLIVGERYLKNFDPLQTTAANGITQADLDAAENAAFHYLNARLALNFKVSTWAASVPPLIACLADRYASAELIDMKFGRDGRVSPYPAALRAEVEVVVSWLNTAKDARLLSATGTAL